jgi:excisionase family DNA binding protein
VDENLTADEAADHLDISGEMLIRLVNAGTIPTSNTGAGFLFDREAVLAYKEATLKARREVLAELVAYDQELGI